jgi:FdhD protein
MPKSPVTFAEVERVAHGGWERARDLVAVEEPLQILLEHGEGHRRAETPLAMTMRTPGHDRELVIGFLYGEGVITDLGDVLGIRHCARSKTPGNVVRVALHERVAVPERLLERALPMNSACGVCGNRTIEALAEAGREGLDDCVACFHSDAIRSALLELERAQAWFRHTGGTHGAALFDPTGGLHLLREDVGRHNALDKLIGAWLSGPPHDGGSSFVVLTSRASFELVQKTVRAAIPMLVAIGAPSSLAIETARRFGLTLVGFARGGRFNVYAGADRIVLSEHEHAFCEVGAAE